MRNDIDEFVRWAQDPLTVADAVGVGDVVEFFDGPDWYQLRLVVGKRFPEHRFRWAEKRGEGWSTWRDSRQSQMRGWSRLPAVRVAAKEAESDPLNRWKAVSASVQYLPIRPGELEAKTAGTIPIPIPLLLALLDTNVPPAMRALLPEKIEKAVSEMRRIVDDAMEHGTRVSAADPPTST